ncbi:exocyst complex component Sec10-domain-containing protein [Amylostereum chailletii]|nr:exocyst complex component Sec10-domain-containing protein [Amylostereum chailletii]
MDKFKALEPVRLYQQEGSPSTKTSHAQARPTGPLIGRLPSHLHLLILSFLPVPDIPSYSRLCRAVSRLASSEDMWKQRYRRLRIEECGFGDLLDELDAREKGAKGRERESAPPTITVDVADDEFGEFTTGGDAFSNSGSQDLFAPAAPDELGDFVGGGFAPFASAPTTPVVPSPPSSRASFIRVHALLKPLTPALLDPPHQILTSLFPPTWQFGLHDQARILHILFLYLSPDISPLRGSSSLLAGLRAAADRFDAALLTAFEAADGRAHEEGMRLAAEASWEVWMASSQAQSSAPTTFGFNTEWEMGRVWAEKREIFYTVGTHKPLDNFTPSNALAFDAMDSFMGYILDNPREHGSRAVRVFPASSNVLVNFAERIATDVVGEYITPLLTHARTLTNGSLFLRANAACFREAWRMVDVLTEVAAERGGDTIVTRTQAEDVVYRMFEPNMDEYLDEEVEVLKQALETVCRGWEKQTSTEFMSSSPNPGAAQPTFLSSSSPSQLKRSVLSSFTNVLLLPVTIVPRTVVATATTVSGAAVQGIAMLDPRRWGGVTATAPEAEYRKGGEAGVLWDGGANGEDGEGEEDYDEKADVKTISSTMTGSTVATTASSSSTKRTYDNLQLLLSLDVTLELIHASREAIKRVETFTGYPGTYGVRVRETIEEAAAELLGVLGTRHVKAGFEAAIAQMRTYQPPALPEATSVAPLVQFFELVHVGDMIQSIVQVYFDKELAPHVDVTDFLNTVVREKKRFENALDDSVALGLNAGIEVLMNQVDHIILALTPPRTYYPPEDAPLLLGPSKGCTAAIRCLEEHIRLLKGNVNREVLEVFEGEVGLRLIGILQKHIKRQIISLNGGFQVIADLNAYHAFIATLKIPALTADFSNLKMLGHVYVVEDAKDLAQIVRDVTRYGGAYRPEDIYEFVQRRSDWKKIEKIVDKTMYNLNLREDCVVC